MGIPKNESGFDFVHIGEITGKKYDGQFTVKCMLNLADKRMLEIEKSRLTADLQNPTGNLNALGTVIANLRIRIIDAPDWYNQLINNLDTLDEELIFELYTQCLKKSDEWRESVKAKMEEKSEGNVPKES